MIGIGYQESRKQQKAKGKNESAGHEEFLLYFGRAHLVDEATGVEARGLLKIGRGKYKTALMRGRNQPGIDFRVYAEIIVSNNYETHWIENLAKTLLKEKNILGSQGQRELYRISDSEITNTVNSVVSAAKEQDVNILEVNFYI